MSPEQRGSGGQPQPIQFDPNNALLRDHRKQIASITGESTKLNKIPGELETREPDIQQAFAIARDGLAAVLLSPDARRAALEYCAIGAQVQKSVSLIENRFEDSEGIAKKKYKTGNYPKPVTSYLDAVANYVLTLDLVDPLASLDPELEVLATTEFPHTGFLIPLADINVAETYARIGNNFSQVEGPEQNAMVAFLTELGINKYEIANTKEQRTGLRQINVFPETQADLQRSGVVMNQYFRHYARYLFNRMYGEAANESQITAYPDYDASSALPQALGVYLAESRDIFNEYRDLLPTVFKCLLDNGLIPHLSADETAKIAVRHAEKFYQRNGDIRALQDKAGRSPYELAELSSERGVAFDYFSRLAVEYAEENTLDPTGPLFDNLIRIYDFLKGKFITTEGDRLIAAIDISATTSNLDIIVIGHNTDENGNPETVAIQVDDTGRVYGLPSAYGFASASFVNYAIDKSLKTLEAEGFKMLSSEEVVERADLEIFVEEELQTRLPMLRLRAKHQDELRALAKQEYDTIYAQEKARRQQEGVKAWAPEPREGLDKKPTGLRLPVEQGEVATAMIPRGPARYTIEVSEDVLDTLAKEPDLLRRLLAAVERVRFSPRGSNVMKKLKSIGQGTFRIAFSGNRALLQKDDEGTFHVTDVIKRDSQTYNIARRRLR